MGNTCSKRNEPKSCASMRARQYAKITELRQVFLQAGYQSLDKQASALGLSRSTTWAVLQANHKSPGLSGSVIKHMLRSRDLPPAARQWIEEYVAEKLAGTYGHGRKPLRIFRGDLRTVLP
jgi:hypothetical protein